MGFFIFIIIRKIYMYRTSDALVFTVLVLRTLKLIVKKIKKYTIKILYMVFVNKLNLRDYNNFTPDLRNRSYTYFLIWFGWTKNLCFIE